MGASRPPMARVSHFPVHPNAHRPLPLACDRANGSLRIAFGRPQVGICEMRRVPLLTQTRQLASGVQFHWLSVGRRSVCLSPCVFALIERRHIGQTFRRHQTLQCRQPMMVVSRRVIVRFAAIDRLTQFPGKRRGPFAPREVARVMQSNSQCKGLRLPGFSEDAEGSQIGRGPLALTSCQAGSR